MSGTLSRTFFLMGACALLGAFGCGGAPAAEEAQELRQTRQYVTEGVDLSVESVITPPSAGPGGGLDVTATVCNHGTWEEAFYVDIQLALEPNPSSSYISLGQIGFTWVGPGECITTPGFVWNTVLHGDWYVLATAHGYYHGGDTDLSNDTLVGSTLHVGYEPDFFISSISTPGNMKPGAPFTAEVTVCNQGTDIGTADVQLVLSEDSTITFPADTSGNPVDMPLTSFSTDLLWMGQCATRQVQLSAQPPHEGAWYLGAVANPNDFPHEFNRANNTAASGPFGIGYRPDYVISSVSGPASILPGAPFTASVTVCNQGTQAGAGTLVQLVLSEDSTIVFSNDSPEDQDAPLASFSSGPLKVGQCTTQPVQATVQPLHDGPGYLGAVADPGHSEPELVETNNSRPSELIGMGSGPDYVIQSVQAPSVSGTWEPFMASVTVCNQGTAASGGTVVNLVLSLDGDPQNWGWDPWVGSFFTAPLEAGQCTTQQVQAWLQPPFDGAWYLMALADVDNYEPELLETNNTFTRLLHVGYQPDLFIQSVSGPAAVVPGAPFTASVTLCNRGNAPSWGDGVLLVLSEDPSIADPWASPSGQDLPLTTVYVSELAPGQCKQRQAELTDQAPHEGLWYLGAVANPGNYQLEFDRANNTRASAPMGIGLQPDLVISSVSGPVSLLPGAPFTASVQVCNQGTQDSSSVQVRLVLSESSTIRFSVDPEAEQDVLLASFSSGPLVVGQCIMRQVQTSAQVPHEGTWYLGAVADTGNAVPEFNEANNTRASQPMGIGQQPDFIVQSVSGPSSLLPGAPFTASVQVCNQGTTDSSAAQVQLVLSQDTSIVFSTPPSGEQDLPLSSFILGALAPGQCTTQQVQATADAPIEGTWYLGAVADTDNAVPEFNEANNTRASQAMGIGYRPDFVVTSVKAPAAARPYDYIQASVTVCNQGTVGGEAVVDLLLSSDQEILPWSEDVPVQSVYPGWLEPGQCVSSDTFFSAYWSLSEGDWYLGAIAQSWYQLEFDATNNTLASSVIHFGYKPDFSIQSVSGPVNASPGNPFTASVKVCNEGTVSGTTDVLLLLSEDAAIASSSGSQSEQDLPLASFSSGLLAAGQCTTRQVQASAQPPHEGLWYLGAVADFSNSTLEFDETNNTGASEPFGIGNLPDYVIRSVSGPASALPGATFTASVTVCNQGTADGASAPVQLVLSEDSTITSSGGAQDEQDLPLASLSSGPLKVGQCATQQVQASAQVPHDGPWYLGAVADPSDFEPELSETNNSRAGKAIGIGDGPDYVIQSVVSPSVVGSFGQIMASMTVCNQGTSASAGTQVQLVLSQDDAIHGSDGLPGEEDMWLASLSTGPLAAGQCITQQVQASLQLVVDGTWYLGAVADPGDSEPELLEANNTYARVIHVGWLPDFVIQSVSVPPAVTPEGLLNVSITACNQGNAYAWGDAMVVLSDNPFMFDSWSSPEGQDLPTWWIGLNVLAPGQCSTQQVQISPFYASHEGLWYVGVIADPYNYLIEFDKTNNTAVSAPVGIGHQPDLVIQSVSGPASLLPGASFTASVQVCNQGTSDSGSAQVQLLLSQDTTIRLFADPLAEQDLPLASFMASPLAAGQCTMQQVQASAQVPHEGTWYLGAVADTGNAVLEFNEDNNSRASEPVGIGHQPDLIVRSVSGPPAILLDAPFTASVQVCNQGTVESGSTQVQFLLSQDTTIRVSSESSEEQDLSLASLSVAPLKAGKCVTKQVETVAQGPQQGTWYLGAVVDPDGSVPELIETNNSGVSEPVGFGAGVDFVIQSVVGPSSTTPWSSFPARITVCNQGTIIGGTAVTLVLSNDTTLDLPYQSDPWDIQLDTFWMELGAGQCATQELYPYVWNEGTWHLGAVADLDNYQLEFNETNNTRFADVMSVGYGPEYSIASVSGPGSVRPGEPFTASVKVCNQGTNYGYGAQVNLVLSEDATIGFSSTGAPAEQDLLLASFSLNVLGTGQCATRQVQTSAQPPHGGIWYLGAVVEPSSYEQDLNPANNTGSGGIIGIGDGPDLVIPSVSVPGGVTPGETFLASVKVCNQGTSGSGGVQVQLLLSGDSIFAPSSADSLDEEDLPLTSFAVEALEAGQCTTQQVQTSAQPEHEGLWYMGAVVDPDDAVPELNELNNSRASEALGVGHRADFVIQAVSGPVSILPDQVLPVDLTVCNQGTVSGATDVMLLLSDDTSVPLSAYATPSEQDRWLATFASGELAPGQCTQQHVEVGLWGTFYKETWYLGAVADPANVVPELNETNNTRVSKRMNIGYRADFTLVSVSSPAGGMPGGSGELQATTCNHGTVGSEGVVRVYASLDNELSSELEFSQAGLFLGWNYTGWLEPGQCATSTVPVTWPSQEGDWYLGAVAASDNWDFDSSNDLHTGNHVQVGYQPDFLIQEVGGPSGIAPGESFTASVKVCNQGTLRGGTDVQLVLSEDATIRFSSTGSPAEQDLPLVSFSTGTLEPGQCRTFPMQASVYPPHDGTWYLGAVADFSGSTPEFDETNNTRASKPIGTGYLPDFTISSVNGPGSAAPGAPFTASVQVCNEGTATGSTEVLLVLSEDDSIHFSSTGAPAEQDVALAAFSTGMLAPGQCEAQPVQASAQPPHEGIWYLGAVANPDNAVLEFDPTNNTSASEPVGIGNRADFVIQQVHSLSAVQLGQPLAVETTVCNRGTVSGSTDVQLVLSQDATIHFTPNGPTEEQDLPLASFSTGVLAPGQCRTRLMQTSPSAATWSLWYLGAVADPGNTTPELSETNNASPGKPLSLGERADFRVQSVVGPASALPGGPMQVEVTVCNDGTLWDSGAAYIYLSEDQEISESDTILGMVWLPPLDPGSCATRSSWVVAPTMGGTWYVGAIASWAWWEVNSTNNALAGGTLEIGTAPDFLIQEVSGPDILAPGQLMAASVKVCNQGTVSGGTQVQLVLSEDATIRFAANGSQAQQDLPLTSFYSGALEPGQCTTHTVETSVALPHDGAWYLGAVADPGHITPELLETNNSRASAAIGIGARPDFVIQNVTGRSNIENGGLVAASVTVCNQGTMSGSTDVQLVLSADDTIRFASGSIVYGADLPLASLQTGPLEPSQCETRFARASVQAPYEGAWYLGAVADPGSSRPELLETNNSRASAPIGIGHQPDFIILDVSGPSHAGIGEMFPVDVLVCNQGTASGSTDVQLVLSEDTTLDLLSGSPPFIQDISMVTFSSGTLEPGECTTQQVQASSPAPFAHAWHLGAVATPGQAAPELLESNNTLFGGLISIGLPPP